MGSPSVVMPCVLGEDGAQVPFAEDQHTVGDLGPDGAHEPFRVGVRSVGSRWDLDGGDAYVGEDRVGEGINMHRKEKYRDEILIVWRQTPTAADIPAHAAEPIPPADFSNRHLLATRPPPGANRIPRHHQGECRGTPATSAAARSPVRPEDGLRGPRGGDGAVFGMSSRRVTSSRRQVRFSPRCPITRYVGHVRGPDPVRRGRGEPAADQVRGQAARPGRRG